MHTSKGAACRTQQSRNQQNRTLLKKSTYKNLPINKYVKLRKTFVFRPFLLCISKMKRICTNMENEADLTSRTTQTPTSQLKSHLLQAMQPETVWMDGWIDGRIAGLAASVFRVPHSLKSIRVFFVSFSSFCFWKKFSAFAALHQKMHSLHAIDILFIRLFCALFSVCLWVLFWFWFLFSFRFRFSFGIHFLEVLP